MTDNIPKAPPAPARKKRPVMSDLATEVQMAAEAKPAEPAKAKPAEPAEVPAKTKGQWREGSISVPLGLPLRDRLNRVQKLNALTYDSIADLVREAITEKLDKLEK